MSIEAKSALISTASVEIKTLTLNGKQMTLSVFRQLPRAVPVGGVAGSLWGTVNYHPDPLCKGLYESEHLHVVSNAAGQLIRTFAVGPDMREELYHSHNRDCGYTYMWTCGHRRELSQELRECLVSEDEWDDLRSLPQLFIAV